MGGVDCLFLQKACPVQLTQISQKQAVLGKEDLILTFDLSFYFRKPHGELPPFSLQLYDFGGDSVTEGFIMLYEKDRGLEG